MLPVERGHSVGDRRQTSAANILPVTLLSNRCDCHRNLTPACPSTPSAPPRLSPGRGSAPWLLWVRCSLRPEGRRSVQRAEPPPPPPLGLWLHNHRHPKGLEKVQRQHQANQRSPPLVLDATVYRRPCPSKTCVRDATISSKDLIF